MLKTEQNKIPTLQEKGNSSNIVLDISGLFIDKDQAQITPDLTHNIPKESGISVQLTGNTLTLFASDYIGTSGEFSVALTANDMNSTSKAVGSASAIFNVNIEAANLAPEVDYDEYALLQKEISGWQLEVGVPFEQTINIVNLFTDKDGDIVSYRTGDMTIPGLTVSPQEGTNPIITISGTPTKATAADASEAFMVHGVDNEGASAYQEMLMPQVAEGVNPVPDLHSLVGKTLYNIENETLWSDDFSGPRPDGLAYCQSMLLAESGKVYWSATESTSDCPEVDMNVVGGTWEIDSTTNLITITESDSFQMEMKLSDTFNSFTGNAIYQIDDSEIEDDAKGKTNTFMAFTSQADAARQLKTLSTADCSGDTCPRDFEMVLPSVAETDGKYDKNVLGTIGLSLEYNDNDTMDADIHFDLPSNLESCEYLNTHFESFWITGTDVNGETFSISSIECYDDIANDGTPGGDNSAKYDFDFDTEIKPDSTVSFIAFAKDDMVNNVTMSLVWDGYKK